MKVTKLRQKGEHCVSERKNYNRIKIVKGAEYGVRRSGRKSKFFMLSQEKPLLKNHTYSTTIHSGAGIKIESDFLKNKNSHLPATSLSEISGIVNDRP